MIVGVLGMGRRMAESRMTDTCKVTRVTRGAFNETTGKYAETTIEAYSGVCRLRHPTTPARDAEAASQLVTVGMLEIHVPVGTAAFRPDDLVEITASESRGDQVGRRFTIRAPFDGTQTTALRYRVEASDARS